MNTSNRDRLVKWAYTAGRIMLGLVFIYASWDKVLNPEAFAEIVLNYQILPKNLVGPVALILPWIELICGISLVIHRWSQGSALIVSGLMVVFMCALGYNAYRGMDVACGCFTLDGSAPGSAWLNLLRDSLLLATAVFILFARPARRRPSTAQPAIPS